MMDGHGGVREDGWIRMESRGWLDKEGVRGWLDKEVSEDGWTRRCQRMGGHGGVRGWLDKEVSEDGWTRRCQRMAG